MTKPGPCKDCQDRRVGCHAVCEPYLTWAAQKRAVHQIEVKKRQMDVHINEMAVHRIKRALRGKRK